MSELVTCYLLLSAACTLTATLILIAATIVAARLHEDETNDY